MGIRMGEYRNGDEDTTEHVNLCKWLTFIKNKMLVYWWLMLRQTKWRA
jgi:hypothetical protein